MYNLLLGYCIEKLNELENTTINMIFADPQYFLSNGGITCQNGKMDYYVINEIVWVKPNAAPNLGCRCFMGKEK